MTRNNPIRQVEEALVFLGDRCDGALKLDGQGFNGRDTEFGKSLARQIRAGAELTEKQLRGARRMLMTYLNSQLAPAGLSLPTEQELDAAMSRPKPAFELYESPDDPDTIILKWSYREKERYLPVLKKEVPPRFCKFNPQDCSWTVDASYKRALKKALKRA